MSNAEQVVRDFFGRLEVTDFEKGRLAFGEMITDDCSWANTGFPTAQGKDACLATWDGFNQTLWDELAGSGVLEMVAKSMYPLTAPQQPSDFKPPSSLAPLRRGDPPRAVQFHDLLPAAGRAVSGLSGRRTRQ